MKINIQNHVGGDVFLKNTQYDLLQSFLTSQDGFFYNARVLHLEQSQYQTISVWQSQSMGKILCLDDQTMLSESDWPYYHEALLSVLGASESKKKCLIVGGGDGVAACMMAKDFEQVQWVEIDEAVARVSKKYFGHLEVFNNGFSTEIGNIKSSFCDAMEYIKLIEPGSLDAIAMDLNDPIDSNCVGALYSLQFLENTLNCLSPTGLCSWQLGSARSNAGFSHITQLLNTHVKNKRFYKLYCPLYHCENMFVVFANNSGVSLDNLQNKINFHNYNVLNEDSFKSMFVLNKQDLAKIV